MKRNFPLIVLALLMAMGTLVAGNMYWSKKKGAFFQQLYARKSFSLLDNERKIFNTKDLPAKALLIFTPDAIPVSSVKPFRFLLKDLRKERGAGVYVAVVSRVHEDIIRNFLHAAGFKGKVLFDPSGAFGRYLGAWPTMEPAQDWTFIYVDNDLKVNWAVAKDEVPRFQEFSDKF